MSSFNEPQMFFDQNFDAGFSLDDNDAIAPPVPIELIESSEPEQDNFEFDSPVFWQNYFSFLYQDNFY